MNVAVLTGTAFSFQINQQKDPWKVPGKYEKLKNPLQPNEAFMHQEKNYTTISVSPAMEQMEKAMEIKH